ncbi:MAG TPA: polysaccharide biosynthesis/export family protein [Thermoanaerobaculia bacterium]|nr:polysaccharide biosynthesis/export family protein [Thermoanaerobaculia bacterium]
MRWAPFSLLAWIALAGCTGNPAPFSPPAPAPALPAPPVAAAERSDYVLQPGDTVQIKFFYNPELDDLLPIRPDGKISLQLVGEVKASGMTPAGLSDLLQKRYGKTLRNPQVAVMVKEFGGRKIYVGGEVQAPGIIRPAGDVTALQAIFEAGGFKSTAQPANVVILRYQGGPQPLFLVVDLRVDAARRTAGGDTLLEPHDIVFVPKSRVARMDQFVDQYIRQLTPMTLSLGVSYVFGTAVIH